MIKGMTMARVVLLGLLAMLTAACSSTFEGQRGALANPLRHITQAPELFHHLPVLREHPAPLGPAMDAYPVVEPPVVKRIWIVAHDNLHGDRVSGHYVDVLYHPPRFAPLLGGKARLPVAPRVEPITPAGPSPAPSPPLQHESAAPPAPPSVAAPRSTAPVSGAGVSPELLERLQRIRQRMLQQVPPPPPVLPHEEAQP